MSDKDANTPRVYLYRHGETAWTISGQHTGTTELPLTERGEKQVLASGKLVVGKGKLIDPSKLARVFVSPRKRAQRTFELAFGEHKSYLEEAGRITVTDQLAEWDYGSYEGLVSEDIRKQRKSRGLDKERSWDIWRDGCEGGESPQDVTDRLDKLIEEIRTIQAPKIKGETDCDAHIVLVAHGHLLRAFVKRWLNYPMEFNLTLMLEPGAVGAVSYEHHDINSPAVLVGMGFPVACADLIKTA